MEINLKKIIEDSNHIYGTLKQNIKYLYNELQELTNMDDTQLCLAICQLLREGKNCQRQENNLVYYHIKK